MTLADEMKQRTIAECRRMKDGNKLATAGALIDRAHAERTLLREGGLPPVTLDQWNAKVQLKARPA